MVYKVLGIEAVEYENKQGKIVKGERLHLGYDKHGVDGMAVEVLFVSDKIDYDVTIGDNVRVYFNKYGSVAQVEALV